MFDIKNFQTPKWCCDYMVSMIPKNSKTVLEPTPGAGNLVESINQKYKVFAPEDFYTIDQSMKFDCVCMNPPFTPMQVGYDILFACMEKTDSIIALMPWLTMINSEKRTKLIMDYGLISITHLPRKTFAGSRVQCCILEMRNGYRDDTIFKII